ncbi:cell division protein FtsZ [Marinomonas sp. SBI22]|jgi:cell division protein FtsZ|uniref:cell division protein FtsZ n=1 Tax=unclassified Marinomonas TaxID=196814 RepID=UPI0005FA1C72|nr:MULTISPECIES: cell division protein FtsZ [unclassified Marinomonas]KJZ09949.1 cell division protein FtsZ [Marinomonas sp. S3726]KZM39089.1 cell division protein FtsZ [Marinomonas sp. SBI22]KZM39873.1 cell division protein FtsZ [Marinomonas sp. SBI8L]
MNVFDLAEENLSDNAMIKVVGVGGGGGNAVRYMLENQLEGVEFICANTDSKALVGIDSGMSLQIGSAITKGLGAGANPDVGRDSALEDQEKITELLSGADMVFITAGMGGGTGTGAAPVIAKVARDLGILTVAVVTKPFPFEGRRRAKVAEAGVKELRENVDSLIIVPNERLLPVLGKNISLLKAFGEANNVLFNAVQGITDLIMRPGLINVDFADVRTVMSEMGMAMMGIGASTGEDRALVAAESAIHNPLLEDINLKGARGVLVNITANEEVGLSEFTEVGNIIEEYASEDATVVIGCAIDPSVGDEMRVTVVATGLESAKAAQQVAAPAAQAVEKVVVAQAAAPVQQVVNSAVETTRVDAVSVTRGNVGEVVSSRPAEVEKTERVDVGANAAPQADEDKLSYLDIPAFLRRQAD